MKLIKKGFNENDGKWYELIEDDNFNTFKFRIVDDNDNVINRFKRQNIAEREFDVMVSWSI
jgi:hypothetical protein